MAKTKLQKPRKIGANNNNNNSIEDIKKSLDGGLYLHSSPPKVVNNPPGNSKIREFIRAGDVHSLEELLLAGYGPSLLNQPSTDRTVRNFLKTVPAYMNKIDLVHDAVDRSNLRDLKALLDRRKLSRSRDSQGMGLLHKAVLNGNKDIVDYLLYEYPESANIVDNDGRTPLHYCAASKNPEEMFNFMSEKVMETQYRDDRGKPASYYMQNPYELSVPRRVSPKNSKNNNNNRRKPVSKKNSPTHKIKTPPKRDGLNITGANIRIWIHDKDLPKLEQIVWDGQGHRLLNETSNNAKVRQFLHLVPRLMTKIKEIHQAAISGDLDTIEAKVDQPEMLLAKDQNGLNPLHRAAALGHNDICEWIVNKNPNALYGTDKKGRIPLHYATVPTDGGIIFDSFVKNGADATQEDYFNKSPDYYRGRPGEIDFHIIYEPPTAPRRGGLLASDYPPSKQPSRNNSPGRQRSDDSKRSKNSNNSNERRRRRRSLPAGVESPRKPIFKSNKPSSNASEESQNSKSDASRYTESDGGDPDRKKKKNPRRIRNTERLSNLYNKGRKDFVGKRKYVDMRGVTEKEINKMIADGDVNKLEYVVLSGRGGALDGKTSWNDNVKRFLKKVPSYMEQIELLQVYASDGDLDMVKKITRENSKYAMGRNKDGAIALHFAASSGDYDTTKHLLDIYPEGMYVEDRERRVPVHWAALAKNEGHLEVFELLEKKGSYIHACDLHGRSADQYLREEGLLPYAISRSNSRRSRSSQPNSRGQSVTPSRSKSGSPERDKDKSPAETEEKDSPKEEEEGETSERRSRSRTRKNSKAIEEEEEGKSRSPSKKGSRSRSRGKEESEKQTRSKSKSPTPSNSKQPSRSTSKASVRSKSKTPSNTSKPPSNTSKTSKRSKSKSPTGSKAKSRSRSRSKTPKKEGEEKEGEKDKPKKKKKRKKRPETPEVVKPPHDEEVEQAIRGAENENHKGISKLILQGDGYRLVGATSSNEEVQMFLDDLPDSLKSIKDIQKSIEEGDLRGAQNLLDRKEKAFVRDANQCNLLHTATIHGHTDVVRYLVQSFPDLINQQDSKGRTPLHYSAILRDGGHIMKVLKSAKADATVKDHAGYTADDYKKNHDLLTQKQLLTELAAGKAKKEEEERDRNEQWQRYDKANLLAVPGEEEEDEDEEEEEKEEEEDKPEEDKPDEDANKEDNGEDKRNEEIEREVEEAIKAAEKGKHEPLSNIVRRGDGKFLIGKKSKDKDVQGYLLKIPHILESINELFTATEEGETRVVGQLLDRKDKARVKTTNGAGLLHVAVINGHSDTVRYLVQNFPVLIREKDNDDRSALHYAAVVRDGGHLYKILEKAGADNKIKDKSGYTPENYLDDAELLTQWDLMKTLKGETVEDRRPITKESAVSYYGSPEEGMKNTDDQTVEELSKAFEKLQKTEGDSLLKKYLTRDIYDTLKHRVTESGATLLDVIKSGVENPDSSIGVYAPDSESYVMFKEIFDPIIKDYHQGFQPTDEHPKVDFGDPDVFGDLNAPADYVLSTRIRCARSLEAYPFNSKMTEENYEELEQDVEAALDFLDGDLAGYYTTLSELKPNEKKKLTEEHLLFNNEDRFLEAAGAFHYWPKGRGIYLNSDNTFIVWVNEEDHMRIISMEKGGNVKSVYKRFVNALSSLEEHLHFSNSQRLGHLNFCPTNIGTGIRASVHIRLPNLGKDREKLEELAAGFNLQVRGTSGEHSEVEDYVFDISNKRRVGLTEFETIQEMYDGIEEIIRYESEYSSEDIDNGNNDTVSQIYEKTKYDAGYDNKEGNKNEDNQNNKHDNDERDNYKHENNEKDKYKYENHEKGDIKLDNDEKDNYNNDKDEKDNYYKDKNDKDNFASDNETDNYERDNDKKDNRYDNDEDNYGRDNNGKDNYRYNNDEKDNYSLGNDGKDNYHYDKDEKDNYRDLNDEKDNYRNDKDEKDNYRDGNDERDNYGNENDEKNNYRRDDDEKDNYRYDNDKNDNYGYDNDKKGNYGHDNEEKDNFEHGNDGKDNDGHDTDKTNDYDYNNDGKDNYGYTNDKKDNFNYDNDEMDNYGHGSDGKDNYGHDNNEKDNYNHNSEQDYENDNDKGNHGYNKDNNDKGNYGNDSENKGNFENLNNDKGNYDYDNNDNDNDKFRNENDENDKKTYNNVDNKNNDDRSGDYNYSEHVYDEIDGDDDDDFYNEQKKKKNKKDRKFK